MPINQLLIGTCQKHRVERPCQVHSIRKTWHARSIECLYAQYNIDTTLDTFSMGR